MKKKGRWIPVIGCLMLVLFLAGCGKTIDIQSTAEQEIPSQNQIVVGVSQLGSESMWRTANSASIQQALCKENGYFLLFNNARLKQFAVIFRSVWIILYFHPLWRMAGKPCCRKQKRLIFR